MILCSCERLSRLAYVLPSSCIVCVALSVPLARSCSLYRLFEQIKLVYSVIDYKKCIFSDELYVYVISKKWICFIYSKTR